MATELYANVATTTVSSGGTTAPAGGTSEAWTVASSTPFPAAATGVSQFHVADPAAPTEIMLVTNVSGTTWTVTRGAESTTPVTHSAGFTIWLVVTSGDLTAMLVAGNNLSDVTSASSARSNLGLGAAAVIGTPVSIANGGTGQASQQAAMDALAGAVTSGDFLRGNATHVTMAAIQAGDLPAGTTSARGALQLDGTASDIQPLGASAGAGATGLAADAEHVHPNTGLVTGVTAGDTSIVVGGTSAAPTIETATLDVIATDHAPAGNWSNNSHKITSLANGAGAQDAAAFGQIPLADSTASDIQKVGTAAVAGANGKWADSGHVHPGFFGGIFGTGSDGAVTLDGSTTYNGFSSLAGSTYTLTRDVMATNLTINNTVILKPAGYRIFCQGTLTNNGTITVAGANGSGGAAGAGGGANGVYPVGKAGGAGGTGVSGAGAPGGNANWGVTGGAGGAGTSGGAGAGGTVTQSNTIAQNNIFQTPYAAITGLPAYNGSIALAWGAGGGGGGSDASSNAGGGGGGGGGMIVIFAWAVNNGSGTLTAAGGNGAAAAAGNAGGGGGGSGGLVLAFTLSAWTAGTVTVSGGALGALHGSGSNGNAGGTGLSLNVVLA